MAEFIAPETVDAGKTLGELAKELVTAEPTMEDTRSNGEVLDEHGLRIMHFRPVEHFHNGFTLAFKVHHPKANVIEVASSITHPKDTFTKKVGTRIAVEAFLSGRTVLLPIPEFLRKSSTVDVIFFYFG